MQLEPCQTEVKLNKDVHNSIYYKKLQIKSNKWTVIYNDINKFENHSDRVSRNFKYDINTSYLKISKNFDILTRKKRKKSTFYVLAVSSDNRYTNWKLIIFGSFQEWRRTVKKKSMTRMKWYNDCEWSKG